MTAKRRVAARMAAAALEARGHETLLLPTQLLSGTYDLGEPAALDTTPFLLGALARWEALGVSWDCALIGGVTGTEQARALCALAERTRARGAWVLVDPILGDGGKRYASVTEDQTQAMRLLSACADVVTPNLTEACLLTGVPYAEAFSERQAQERMLHALSQGGARSALITSARTPEAPDAVLGYDAKRGERFCIPFERVPGRHLATGDLFSALLADGLLHGETLKRAAGLASEAVGRAVRGEGDIALPN